MLCMESQNENQSLQDRIREVENENQSLRTQNLLQNRTIIELRNELMLLRIRMNELSDTSALLRERVRNLVQNSLQLQQQENEGLVIAPPLMAPPPAPPPLPTGRVRISPRQVGAGEAITTPLGISLSTPPRHRVKRDCRQGVFRPTRNPFRRLDLAEPGPSTESPIYLPDRPNYFVGLKIIPQFQSFVCTSDQPSSYNDSASDSSGSDDNAQVSKKSKSRPTSGESTFEPVSRNLDLINQVSDLTPQKAQTSILQNYNFALPTASKKFFFPLPWGKKNRDSTTLPSTSGNEVEYYPTQSNRCEENGLRSVSKVSNCTQYTFPTIHEGLHHSGVNSVVGNTNTLSRLRKLKKNIPYISTNGSEEVKTSPEVEERNSGDVTGKIDSESLLSLDEITTPRVSQPGEMSWDCDQDGFQADESSNCMTSTDTSLEKISISESNMKHKD